MSGPNYALIVAVNNKQDMLHDLDPDMNVL